MTQFTGSEITEALKYGFVLEGFGSNHSPALRRFGKGGRFAIISHSYKDEAPFHVSLHGDRGDLITSECASSIKLAIDAAHNLLSFEVV